MNDDQRSHLELIQGVIDRMGANSFFVRGWSITLVAALFALSAKDTERAFVLIAYFPCVLFWFLDAYYLAQERRYRALYNAVRQADSTDFGMTPCETTQKKNSIAASFFSLTVVFFHGAVIGVISIVMWFLPVKAATGSAG